MARDFDTLSTERLLLRGINETDSDLIVKWRSDPYVYKFFKNPHKISLSEHENWFINNYLPDETRFDWMCIEIRSKTRIGVFGLIKGSSLAEINYLLAPEAQHKGYASEALQSLIKYARNQWGINRIIAEIHEANMPSISMIKRLGFEQSNYKEHFTVYEKRCN